MKKILLLLVLLFTHLIACENCYGFPYGQNHLYEIQAPKNWILDNKIGVPMNVHAFLYRKGETLSAENVYMYTTVSHIDSDIKSIEDVVRTSKESFLEKSPQLQLDIKFIETKKFKNYDFTLYKWHVGSRVEYVAYNVQKYVIVMFVLSAPMEEILKENYTAFEAFVGSYDFLTNDVIYREISKEQFAQIKAHYDEQMKDKDAKKYHDEIRDTYLKELTHLVLQCQEKVKTLADFEIQISINEMGLPQTIYWTPSKVADCLYEDGVAHISYPQPPSKYRIFHWHNRFLTKP